MTGCARRGPSRSWPARDASPVAVAAFTSVQQALSALDRLEVRGRDSAGLHLLVRGHGLDLDRPGGRGRCWPSAPPTRCSARGAVRTPDGRLSFVYKAAAEIGELGDNTARAAAAIAATTLLHRALRRRRRRGAGARATPAGPASASSPRPTPIRSTPTSSTGAAGPYVTAALNGDVDNFADLKATEACASPPRSPPTPRSSPRWCRAALAAGDEPVEAFRRDGRRASRARWPSRPARPPTPTDLLLALRGSGQALYVGLAEDAFIVASEPYGAGRGDATYLRMDGETPADPDNPSASRGQIVVLDGAAAGTLDGIERMRLRRHPLPVTDDRAGHRPDHHARHRPRRRTRTSCSRRSPRRRRRSARRCGASSVDGATARCGGARRRRRCPPTLRADCAPAPIRRVLVIGQGTAAVAGQSLAVALRAGRRRHRLRVEALPATELSGFGLRADMSDTLVVAISQSGTTTDTNRTVDLVRARGATVVAIVNRRGSDLTDKSDGVLYTSDGRDVEMSVASTKAFYAQIAAGFLLAPGDRRRASASTRRRPRGEVLAGAARAARQPWTRTLACRPAIAEAAAALAPPAAATGPSSATASNRIAAARDADQALRALLQVDRLRRHRGQEAHRPLVRAADPGVRRRARPARPPTTWPRRSRSTGPTRRRRS